MDDTLLTIGEVARRAGVATSTVRFYERRGLLTADARRSGQRRYRVETLRRLVFIGMLQDAGLSLEDIAGVLDAAHVADWKAIGPAPHRPRRRDRPPPTGAGVPRSRPAVPL
jgi:MerR family redox-sensitive transcriptional activator SoxR